MITNKTPIGLGVVIILISILFSSKLWIDNKLKEERSHIEKELSMKVELQMYNLEKKYTNDILENRFKIIQDDINEIKEILKKR